MHLILLSMSQFVDRYDQNTLLTCFTDQSSFSQQGRLGFVEVITRTYDSELLSRDFHQNEHASIYMLVHQITLTINK